MVKEDPNNKAGKKQLAFVEKKIQQAIAQEKKMYGKMFG